MGMRMIAVINTDSLETLERDKVQTIDRLISMAREGRTGAFGPGVSVVAVRRHDFDGLLYFDGTTLTEVEDRDALVQILRRSASADPAQGSIFGRDPVY